MNANWHDLIQRYITGTLTQEETTLLQEALKADAGLRVLLLDHMNLDAALEVQAATQEATPTLLKASADTLRAPWHVWHPLATAAAGLTLGMFCTTMLYGFINQRSAPTITPLSVFDPGFEGAKPLDKGLPHESAEWGVQSARIVGAENGVRPLTGSHMLRMEPVLMNERDDNFSAKAYQVLDLGSLPEDTEPGLIEAQVSAAFAAAAGDSEARYLIRVVALDEAPRSATIDFWEKVERSEVVSITQRFEAAPPSSGWRPCSLKIPVPPSARSLVLVFSVLVPRSPKPSPSAHYLDHVQVSLIHHGRRQPASGE